jgi:hypothetical protein
MVRRKTELTMIAVSRAGCAFSPLVRRVAGDLADEIGSFHLRDGSRFFDEFLGIDVACGDRAAHYTSGSQHPCERARVDVGDRDDVVMDEVITQRSFRPPVARDR